MKIRPRKNGTDSGMLAEAVSSLALLLPVMLIIVFVKPFKACAYVIARHMNPGAMIAARSLAEEYLVNNDIVTDSAAQDAIFSEIRQDMISDNSQFTIRTLDGRPQQIREQLQLFVHTYRGSAIRL
ncbi:MAG: hypothetical protein R3D26_18100 [Cyanobacteriota/Melainabacteria group bacterium]